MTNSRLFGRHYHRTAQLIGPDTPPGGGGGITGLISYLENADAGDLEYGDVVRIDISNDSAVEKTTTLDDGLVLGVVAAAGPFAPGAQTPVLTVGYHPAVKATGAINAGDFILPSATDGTAEGDTDTTPGSFGRALADAAGGTVAAILLGIGTGGGGGGAATQIEESGGPTTLNIAAVPDLTFLRREGSDIVGRRVAGAGEYSPILAPSSPHASNDEFDDLSLNAAWTAGSSGGGSSGGADETLRKGFLQLKVTDGGGGSGRTIKRAFAPGAVAVTVAARVFGNVRDANSNQVRIEVLNNSGVLIYGVGMVNIPGPGVIFFDNGTFGTVQISYVTPLAGEIYLMVQRDSSTNWSSWVSSDGMEWQRLSGKSISGTIGEILLATYSFSASTTESWWDFIRCFTSQTFVIGGTP